MSCGGCTLCCTLMRVEMAPRPEPPKPAMTPCQHLCGRSCGVYADRPDACRGFECLWLQSQSRTEIQLPMGERPDRTGVVLEGNSKGTVIAHCRTPECWRADPARKRLMWFVGRGITVTIEHGDGRVSVLEKDGTATELEFLDVDPETNERRYRRPRESSAFVMRPDPQSSGLAWPGPSDTVSESNRLSRGGAVR